MIIEFICRIIGVKERGNNMKLFVQYAWHVDIVFHVLTHMKVDNASNLFNAEYVEDIRKEKERQGIADTLLNQVGNITDYYIKHFDRLAVINFVPFITYSLGELSEKLLSMPYFTDGDKASFINPFMDILEEEKTFYQAYWYEQNERIGDRKAVVEAWLGDRLGTFKCIFDYYKQQYNKEVRLFLSYSMGQNGRGVDQNDNHLVAIPFPLEESETTNSFFMTLHELTHPCTDDLVGSNISMEDGSHALTENVVMLADYYLIKAVQPALVEDYFKWICTKCGQPDVHIDEGILCEIFSIPQVLEEKLKTRIREIVKN